MNGFGQQLNNLPSSLKHFSLEGIYPSKSIDHLPSSLISLFCNHLSLPIDHLPLFITTLTLGHRFGEPIDHLPPSLTSLEFDIINNQFNHPIDNLPSSLTRLVLSGIFNQPIDYLPSSLTSLLFGHCVFNQPIDHLPPLISLRFSHGCNFNHPVDNLPLSLKYFQLPQYYSSPLYYLPPSVTTLCYDSPKICDALLPPSLTKIITDRSNFESLRKIGTGMKRNEKE
jgi:hypothetical protein